MIDFLSVKMDEQSWSRAVRRLNAVGRRVQKNVSKKGIRQSAKVFVARAKRVLADMGAVDTGTLRDAVGYGSPDIKQNGDTTIVVAIKRVRKEVTVTKSFPGGRDAKGRFLPARTFEVKVVRQPTKYVHLVHNGSVHNAPKPFFEVAARMDAGPLLDAMKDSMIEGAEEAIREA